MLLRTCLLLMSLSWVVAQPAARVSGDEARARLMRGFEGLRKQRGRVQAAFALARLKGDFRRAVEGPGMAPDSGLYGAWGQLSSQLYLAWSKLDWDGGPDNAGFFGAHSRKVAELLRSLERGDVAEVALARSERGIRAAAAVGYHVERQLELARREWLLAAEHSARARFHQLAEARGRVRRGRLPAGQRAAVDAEIARQGAAKEAAREAQKAATARGAQALRVAREQLLPLRLIPGFEVAPAGRRWQITSISVSELPLAEQRAAAQARLRAAADELALAKRLLSDDAVKVKQAGKLVSQRLARERALRKEMRGHQQALRGKPGPEPTAELRNKLIFRAARRQDLAILERRIIARDERARRVGGVEADRLRNQNALDLAGKETLKRQLARLDAELKGHDAAVDAEYRAAYDKAVATFDRLMRAMRERRSASADCLSRLARWRDSAQRHERAKVAACRAEADLLRLQVAGDPMLLSVSGDPGFLARDRDLRSELAAYLERVERAERHLVATRKTWHRYQAAFEEANQDAKDKLEALGGWTGQVMQSAYLQAGLESAFFLLDAWEEGAAGGPLAALADAVVKLGLQQLKGERAFRTADQGEVMAKLLRGIDPSTQRSLTTLGLDVLGGRVWTESAELSVRDAGIKQGIAAAVAAEGRKSNKAFRSALKTIDGSFVEAERYHEGIKRGIKYFENMRDGGPKLEKLARQRIAGTLKGLVWGYAKDFAKEGLKDRVLAREERAIARYLVAQVRARQLHVPFLVSRDNYWEALAVYRALLAGLKQLRALQEGRDPVSGLTIERKEPFGEGGAITFYASPASERLEVSRLTVGGVEAVRLRTNVFLLVSDRLKTLPKEKRELELRVELAGRE